MDINKKIDRIVEKSISIWKEQNRPVVIGVNAFYKDVGISAGAGKTTIANIIKNRFVKKTDILPSVINSDSFLISFIEKYKTSKQFYSRLFECCMKSLINGNNINIPKLSEVDKIGKGVVVKQSYDIEASDKSLIDFIGIHNMPDLEKLSYGILEKTDDDTVIVKNSPIIIIEGNGIYNITKFIDIFVIGLPNCKNSMNNYINRTINYKIEKFIKNNNKEPSHIDIDVFRSEARSTYLRLPLTSSLEKSIYYFLKTKNLYTIYDNKSESFQKTIDELQKNETLFLLEDYEPNELFDATI
jgi:uridine kinase